MPKLACKCNKIVKGINEPLWWNSNTIPLVDFKKQILNLGHYAGSGFK